MTYQEPCIWRDPELYLFQILPEKIYHLVQDHLRYPEIPIRRSQHDLMKYGFRRHIWSPRGFLPPSYKNPSQKEGFKISTKDLQELGRTVASVTGKNETSREKSSFSARLDAYIKSLKC